MLLHHSVDRAKACTTIYTVEYVMLKKQIQHILPNVNDFSGRTLFVLVLHHGEASYSVQDPSTVDQVN